MKYKKTTCIQQSINLVILLAIVAIIPATVWAEEFAVKISGSTISALSRAADSFNSSGFRTKVNLKLPVAGGVREFSLVPHDIRAKNYRAEVTGPSGRTSDPVSVDLFKGVDGSEVDGEFFRFALIRLPNSPGPELRGYFREKQRYYKLGITSGSGYQVNSLTEEEVERQIASCGVETDLADPLARFKAGSHPHTANAGISAVKIAELATEADFEYVQAEGGEVGANAAILTIVNGVNGIYEQQLNLRLSIVYQHSWTTSADPYTSTNSSTRLDQFLSHWNQNFTSVARDLAHLWTGADLDGSVIGTAYLGVVCNSFAYGLSQRLGNNSGDVPLVAHEIGHNLNSNHDSCSSSDNFIMCPSLRFGSNTFSAGSITQISNYIAAVNCLSSGGGGGTNTPPVLAAIGAKAAVVGQTLSFTVSATDADGDTLTYSASPLPTGATFSNRTFTFRPVTGGSASVTFSVSDGRGGVASESVVITVTGQNQPPVLVAPGSQSTPEGVLYTLALSASDPDGNALSYKATGLPLGSSLNQASGVFQWRPAGNQSGSYSIVFTVIDSAGATDSKTLSLTVTNTAGVINLPARHNRGDMDGNSIAEVAVFRSTTGDWFTSPISNTSGQFTQKQFGLSSDVPILADFNGDRITDYAVFRKSNNTWFILNSGTDQLTSIGFGVDGDIPTAADYDGDGREDIAIFRPTAGLIVYRSSVSAADTVINIGQSGDIPVPCDYDGDGVAEAAVFRPSTGAWITVDNGSSTSVTLGSAADIPSPEDFDGNGRCDRAVYTPATGQWRVEGQQSVQFGLGGDVPAPANYNGTAGAEFAVFRPYEALWYVRLSSSQTSVFQMGLPSDLVAQRESLFYAARRTGVNTVLALSEQAGSFTAYSRTQQTVMTVGLTATTSKTVAAATGATILRGDYDGDGSLDLATFNAGFWTVYFATGSTQSILWGVAGDVPVSADFDGDGRTDIAVWRPNNDGSGFATWYIIKSSDSLAAIYNWGLSTDIPVPADFNGDGWADPTVIRGSTMVWYVMDARSSVPIQVQQWGLPGDTTRVSDFDGDGRADKTVWRNGIWYLNQSGGAQLAVAYGLPGDVPTPGSYVDSKIVDFAVFRPSTRQLFVLTQSGAALSAATQLATGDQIVGLKPSSPLR